MDNKPKLHELTQDDYHTLIHYGMLWVYYPEASGSYYVDVTVPNACNKTLKDLEEDMWKCLKGAEEDKLLFGELNTNPYIGVDYDPSDWVTTISTTESKEDEAEHTGGSVNYYRLTVDDPTSEDIDPYTCECNDIIEGLKMTYAEANVFKATWRKCAERNLGLVKKGNNQVYDAEKMVFFSDRVLKTDKNR